MGGISGVYNRVLEIHETEQIRLSQRISIQYRVLEGKAAEGKEFEGFIGWLSKSDAGLYLKEPLEPLTNIKMNLTEVDEKLSEKHVYAKVIQPPEKGLEYCPVRFTAIPPEIDAYFQAFRRLAK